jgi:hypothetical protein
VKSEKKTELILNIDQAIFYHSNGAELVKFGLVYSERKQKKVVGFVFKYDEKYQELKNKWNTRTR